MEVAFLHVYHEYSDGWNSGIIEKQREVDFWVQSCLVNRMNSETARATQGTQINPLFLKKIKK